MSEGISERRRLEREKEALALAKSNEARALIKKIYQWFDEHEIFAVILFSSLILAYIGAAIFLTYTSAGRGITSFDQEENAVFTLQAILLFLLLIQLPGSFEYIGALILDLVTRFVYVIELKGSLFWAPVGVLITLVIGVALCDWQAHHLWTFALIWAELVLFGLKSLMSTLELLWYLLNGIPANEKEGVLEQKPFKDAAYANALDFHQALGGENLSGETEPEYEL